MHLKQLISFSEEILETKGTWIFHQWNNDFKTILLTLCQHKLQSEMHVINSSPQMMMYDMGQKDIKDNKLKRRCRVNRQERKSLNKHDR